MQVDALAVHLRPRPMAEAADLGVLLVQSHARSILRTWGPLFGGVLLLALATLEINAWLPTVLLFLAKPWMDRSLLFVLSRAVFGESTRFADLWAQRGTVWGRDLLRALTVNRLSPWRAYTQPIGQLEGQHGKARWQRRAQLLQRKRGAALGLHLIFANVEMVLALGLVSLALWFAPAGTHSHVLDWLQDDALGSSLVSTGAYALAIFVLEPFYVAAGFAMYLNRRVELEAWDIEQEFRLAFA